MPNTTAATFSLLGGQFQIGDGATPTEGFTTINQVKSVDFSGSKLDVEEVTSADNTDGIKRHVDRLQDFGECSVEILWNPNDTTHQQLHNAWIAKGTHNFKRINTSGFGTKLFAGIITSFDEKQALDKATIKSCKIKLNGAPTFSIPGA
jgi:hypothetical protein